MYMRTLFNSRLSILEACMLLLSTTALFADEVEYSRLPAATSQEQALNLRLQKLDGLLAEASTYQRYILLDTAAKTALELKQRDLAASYAREIISLAPQFPDDWNFAPAVHRANIILGQNALREDDVNSAKYYLLAAGEVPYSEILDAQGADLELANALLARGQRETVARYLKACASFWPRGHARLERWRAQLAAGQVPSLHAAESSH